MLRTLIRVIQRIRKSEVLKVPRGDGNGSLTVQFDPVRNER